MTKLVPTTSAPDTCLPLVPNDEPALWADAWVREWRACLGSIAPVENGISLAQTLFFRGDTLEQLAQDDSYMPHLRLQNLAELTGARKMLQRLLAGHPRAEAAIAAHLLAEGS